MHHLLLFAITKVMDSAYPIRKLQHAVAVDPKYVKLFEMGNRFISLRYTRLQYILSFYSHTPSSTFSDGSGITKD